MNWKKTAGTLVILFFTLISYTQFSRYSVEDKIEKLLKSKTYVVLHDTNKDFNKYITEAVKDSWTLTEYEFIPFEELKKYSASEKNSFIMASGFYSTMETIKTHTQYYDGKETSIWVSQNGVVFPCNVLVVQLGGKDFNEYQNWLMFCYAGYANSRLESPMAINYVKILNRYIQYLHTEKLDKIFWKNADTHLNTDLDIKSKTIIFWKGDIPTSTYNGEKDNSYLSKSNIQKHFSGNFEIVDDIKLEECIKSKDEKYLFFGTYVEGNFSLIYLYDCNGKIHFYSRMGLIQSESTNWFKAILKKLEKNLE